MASFLRGKQAGVQRDISAGLDASSFAIDEVRGFPLLPVSSVSDDCPCRWYVTESTRKSALWHTIQSSLCLLWVQKTQSLAADRFMSLGKSALLQRSSYPGKHRSRHCISARTSWSALIRKMTYQYILSTPRGSLARMLPQESSRLWRPIQLWTLL